jgi:hypothetical protein
VVLPGIRVWREGLLDCSCLPVPPTRPIMNVITKEPSGLGRLKGLVRGADHLSGHITADA